jgi:hypothetical protein
MKSLIRLSISFIFLLTGVIFSLTSCEKDITVDLADPEIKIVVEGYITPGNPAYVFISRTNAFFAPVDSISLLNSAEKNALVVISNGLNTDTLVPPVPGIGYFYIAPNMVGEVGKTYTLKVVTAAGELVTAQTYIPAPVSLDSIWFQRQSAEDTLGWIWARITEPPVAGNNYRWFAKRLGKDDDFIAPIGSVLNDKFFNGLSFEFAYNRGKKPNSNEDDDNNEEEGFFKVGDSVVVKFASITKESYNFWRAAETQASSNGNPFGSPAPLKSNIIGGIGIWEGFSYTLDTTVAQ